MNRAEEAGAATHSSARQSHSSLWQRRLETLLRLSIRSRHAGSARRALLKRKHQAYLQTLRRL